MSTLPRFEAHTLPRSLVVDPPMSDADFEAFCLANDDIQVERTNQGVIRMNPPAAGASSRGNFEICIQFGAWFTAHGRGSAFDSSSGFYLSDGSLLSPDLAYVLEDRLEGLTDEQLDSFLHVCPNFVIELMSKSDTLAQARNKMEYWIANGVQLAWLIDPYEKQVLVYQQGADAGRFTGTSLAGTEPVYGFILDLTKVWRCYKV